MLAGIGCSGGLSWMPAGIFFLAGMGCLLGKDIRIRLAGLSLLAGMLFMLRQEVPNPLWEHLPPREVAVQLRLDEFFNARREERIAGTGTLMRTDLPFDTISGRTVAYYLDCGSTPEVQGLKGAVIEARGVLTCLPSVEDPDDYQMYLLRRDIFLTINRGSTLRIIRRAPVLEEIRVRLHRRTESVLCSGDVRPESPGRVLASMLLGNRSLLSDERIELYRRTGTYHLFAVSGLHVGTVSMSLALLLAGLRLPKDRMLLPVLAGTWFYIWLTGASPSAVRAGIMISCLGFSRTFFRQYHLFPSLALSAWLVLLIDPAQLFDLGFQLSYGVVSAIVLAGLPLSTVIKEHLCDGFLTTRLRTRAQRLLQRSALLSIDTLCISITASLASMPLIIQHFGIFTPGGAVIGILLNPLATLAIMCGSSALLAGMAWPAAGSMLGHTAWPFLRLMEFLLDLCLAVPGSVMERAWEPAWTGTILTGIMLASAWALQLLRQRGRRLPPALMLLPHAIVLAGLATFLQNT